MNKQAIFYCNIILGAILIAATSITHAMEKQDSQEIFPLLDLPQEIIVYGIGLPKTNKYKDIILAFGAAAKLMRLSKPCYKVFATHKIFQQQVVKYKALLAQANCCDKGCYTPLLTAIGNRDIEQVNYWINNGANCNEIHKHVGVYATSLITPLIEAIESKNIGIVRILLENGANPTGKINPLSFIKSRKDFEIAELLFKYGANVNQKENFYSDGKGILHASSRPLLHKAASNNEVTKVRFWIRHGANPTLLDSYGKLAREYATNQDIIDFLEQRERMQLRKDEKLKKKSNKRSETNSKDAKKTPKRKKY